ncbi:MAG: CoA-disulfide reductase [Treponema sp.]|nr:MAG: CoA-disulfide reductase [Treponema sp.]
MNKYVVVGGVAGGAGVSARLRRLDETARIVIFERGHHISFANCGLPYYAGGVIEERENLFVMTPEKFKASLNVDAKVRHEVISINKEAKTVSVKNLETGEVFEEAYDKLILSPGASPIRPPIPGIDDECILTLRSVSDIDAIKEKIDSPATKRAVVVGGGFIGIEMAENLHERGLKVTVIEAMEQVMNVIDYDMAAIIQNHIRGKGVQLQLKDAVKSFERKNGELYVVLNSGKEIPCDIIILSIGVRPDTALCKAADIDLAKNGAVKVNEYFQTSEKDIYAIGDAIEYTSPLLKMPITIPLAGPANKQARICATNIVKGHTQTYSGSIATSIAKVFDMTIASTGLTEKGLNRAELPFKQIVTHAPNHAGYYPGSFFVTVKVLYNPADGKILGGQVVGIDGVDKRIDVLAAYIMKEGTVYDLAEFEHAYAPPFSSAKDPVNMIGFVAENERDGLTKTVTWKDVEAYKEKGAFFLDVRTEEEFELGAIEGAVNIPNTEIRKRLNEIPKNKPVFINCGMGLRGYLAERILRQNGYSDTVNLTGGYKSYEFAHQEKDFLAHPEKAESVTASVAGLSGDVFEDDGSFKNSTPVKGDKNTMKEIRIDACGLQCPGPIMKVKTGIEELPEGGVLSIKASDPGFSRDIQSWCKLTGNKLLHLDSEKGIIKANIQKGAGVPKTSGNSETDGATFIVFSNDMDKALASFVLANGALASGKKVTMFFTFWGLSVLRKKNAPKVKKDTMGKMFGSMLPKGMGKLSLSSMNFGGMGSKMMKGRMKAKNVDQLETMFQTALDAGVRLVACQMSMDIMGITAEELMDGVEIGGVATYMHAASESGINLFI